LRESKGHPSGLDGGSKGNLVRGRLHASKGSSCSTLGLQYLR
jgi:hypothetical protein